MKIAILGSWRRDATPTEWALHHKEHFKEACSYLGEILAKNGHELVIAQAAPDTADMYAKEGFKRVNPSGGGIINIASIKEVRTWGAAHIAAVEEAEAVIIIGGTDGSYSAGLVALLARKQLIPIGCFGGAARILIRRLPGTMPQSIANTLCDLDPTIDSNWIDVLAKTVNDLLDAYPRILIIHGRSNDRIAVQQILTDAVKEFPHLPEAIIMRDKGIGANAIPDLFESIATQVDAAIALVTPDDLGITAIDSHGNAISAIDLREFTLRARENVWVEVGWFWGRLGRDKLMILKKGDMVSIPTDLGAVIRHSYSESPRERAREIRDFIRVLRTGARVTSPWRSTVAMP